MSTPLMFANSSTKGRIHLAYGPNDDAMMGR